MNMPNQNCLQGIRCPHCGQEDRFLIRTNCLVMVEDDGADLAGPAYGNGYEWDDKHSCRCPECGRSGPLKAFHTRPDLPPDPEDMNDRRAAWAGEALSRFRDLTGTEPGDAVCDLVADLMHWCDRNGQDFGRELERATGHFRAETLGDESETRATPTEKGL
jgi:hypothetical protein